MAASMSLRRPSRQLLHRALQRCRVPASASAAASLATAAGAAPVPGSSSAPPSASVGAGAQLAANAAGPKFESSSSYSLRFSMAAAGLALGAAAGLGAAALAQEPIKAPAKRPHMPMAPPQGPELGRIPRQAPTPMLPLLDLPPPFGLTLPPPLGLPLTHCEAAAPAEPKGEGGVPLEVPPLPPGLVEELVGALGGARERVVQDREELELHAKPWNSYHPISCLPQAVVYPLSTEEVAAVVRLCAARGVPLVAFGGGTSLEGHTTTPRGGISLNLKQMDQVVELHSEDMDVVVQPGVDWISLNQFLEPHGLFFPLDPGPGATIGGMCGTRCSGSMAVRYGTMRDNVISLQVVMANGEVVRTASRARKSSAGYDLTRLMIGSEGTLGVITEVTLRLQPIPRCSGVALAAFPSVGDAAKCATDTMRQGIQVSRVELLDEVMMRAINSANGFQHAEQPTLMFELTGPTPESVAQQLGEVSAIAGANRGSRFVFAETAEEKEDLWRARKEALWAGYTMRPGTEPLITDVCVPLSRLAECIADTKADLQASSLHCPLLAHAGDGNMHVFIFFDPASASEQAEAQALAKRMTLRALGMGGTCTGEHGLGVGKVKYLEQELGAGAVRAMRSVKGALDPQGLMNPGKVLPEKDQRCP